MYEEPYRWVEAVGNRRHYLDEQFKQGSPVVALSYGDGVLLFTISGGTPKLYEVYDRIGLGGMGHPADLEKLRFTLLEMAHLEGFNRSPSDVTASRLMKYGLAPLVKQAFEEVFKAPFIVKIVLAELSLKPGGDGFLTIDYDGTFDERSGSAVLGASPQIQNTMQGYLTGTYHPESASLAQAVEAAVKTWAIGSLAQSAEAPEAPQHSPAGGASQAGSGGSQGVPDDATLVAHLDESLQGKTVECAVLDRQLPGPSKYRSLPARELRQLLPESLRVPR